MGKNNKYKPYPLFKETPINISGFIPRKHHIPALRKGYFFKENANVGGDAPKSFIKVYEYGKSIKGKPKTWIGYIAKVGHKWYPMESITEYLLNRIGEVIGLNIAKPKLVFAGEQIRFLSQYFLDLSKNEQLIHGAQIYSRYLEDEEFVAMANEHKRKEISRELFNFQFTEEAIKATFPKEHEKILNEFVKMLVFDAIVGNNDRHFYNWGIITDLFQTTEPRFSPIYDTARGLFWNESEEKIKEYLGDPKQLQSKLNKYVKNAKPRISWEGHPNQNHFELIEKIFQNDHRYCNLCKKLVHNNTKRVILRLIDEEFTVLMSQERVELIKLCIILRIERLQQIIT
jgi:hypothetical protein